MIILAFENEAGEGEDWISSKEYCAASAEKDEKMSEAGVNGETPAR